jgi:hypothetical protein
MTARARFRGRRRWWAPREHVFKTKRQLMLEQQRREELKPEIKKEGGKMTNDALPKLPPATRETRRNCAVCYKRQKTADWHADFLGVLRSKDGQFYWVEIRKRMTKSGEMCLHVELQPKGESS